MMHPTESLFRPRAPALPPLQKTRLCLSSPGERQDPVAAGGGHGPFPVGPKHDLGAHLQACQGSLRDAAGVARGVWVGR